MLVERRIGEDPNRSDVKSALPCAVNTHFTGLNAAKLRSGLERLELSANLKRFSREDFQILRELPGASGTYQVELAKHIPTDTLVVIKSVRDRVNQRPPDEFVNEAIIASKLSHRHIQETLGIIDNKDGTFSLLTRAVESEVSSVRFLREKPLNKALDVIEQVAIAVGHINGDFLHRDIKPSNIVINLEDQAVVIDLGSAIDIADLDITLGYDQIEIVGSLAYLSPEQALGLNEVLTPASDVFALGLLLYEVVTGAAARPSVSSSKQIKQLIDVAQKPISIPDDICIGINQAVVNVTKRALAHDPKQRYQSAAEFLLALQAARRESTISTLDSADRLSAQKLESMKRAAEAHLQLLAIKQRDLISSDNGLEQRKGVLRMEPDDSSIVARGGGSTLLSVPGCDGWLLKLTTSPPSEHYIVWEGARQGAQFTIGLERTISLLEEFKVVKANCVVPMHEWVVAKHDGTRFWGTLVKDQRENGKAELLEFDQLDSYNVKNREELLAELQISISRLKEQLEQRGYEIRFGRHADTDAGQEAALIRIFGVKVNKDTKIGELVIHDLEHIAFIEKADSELARKKVA